MFTNKQRIVLLILIAIMIPFTIWTNSIANAAVITKDYNIITIEGTIEDGDFDQFNLLFDDSVNHIKLLSGGGLVNEGIKISNLINKYKDRVHTEALGQCTSMCGVIWMSADKHVYNSKQRIGFHIQYVPTRDLVKNIQEEYGWNGVEYFYKEEAVGFIAMTVPFINNKDQVMVYINGLYQNGLLGHQMWYPNHYELLLIETGFQVKPEYAKPKPFQFSDKTF